jgi:hypothetical protein
MLLSSLFITGLVAEATTVDVGGSIRPRVEFSETKGAAANPSFTTMQTRVNVKATVDEQVSAFIQIQDVRTWGGETGTNAPPSITSTGTDFTGNVDFHQAYFVVKDVLGSGFALKIGRQEMVFDEARLIGNIGWIQQAQSFDAARIDGRFDDVSLTGFFSQTNETSTHATLAGTANSAQDSEFIGARATYHLKGKGRITGYWYGAYDPIRVGGTGNMQELHTVGLYAAQTWNGVRLRFDGAYQFGDVSATQDIQASMMTFSIGKKLDVANGAHIAAWLDYMSGDDGTNAARQKNFVTPYATNHKFYGHVDRFLQIPTAGLIDFVVKAWIKPTAKLKLVAHGHKFTSAENTLGAGGGGDDYGSEIDLQLHYALAKNTKAVFGISKYFMGDDTALADKTWGFAMFVSKF